jgi:hypothetical protein
MTPVKEDQEIVENFQPNQLCLQVRGEIKVLPVPVPFFGQWPTSLSDALLALSFVVIRKFRRKLNLGMAMCLTKH